MVHSSAQDYEKKLDFYRQGPGNLAGQMRQQLQRAEDDCANLAGREPAFIAAYLAQLDGIQATLAELGRPGRLNVTPEKLRFQTVQRQMFKQAGPILRRLGGAKGLHHHRPETAQAAEQPWWFLDQYLAERRRRLWKDAGSGLVMLALLGLVVVLVYNRFIRPDKDIEAHAELYLQAFHSVSREADYEAALVAIEEALGHQPDEAESWLLKGIILDELDRSEEAEVAYAQAQALIPAPEQISYLRSRLQLELGQPERAARLAQEAIALNPEYPEAWLMLGLAYEAQEQFNQAHNAMQTAVELADAQGNEALKVMIRINMSHLAGQQ